TYNTKYYWKIIAWDNHHASTTGPVWDFTTENLPPNPPSNPDPFNGETDVDVNHDLSWSCTDPNGDPLTFDVYFGDSSPPPLLVSGHSSVSYDQGTMTGSTTYYWKIVAWDNHAGSTEGELWHFTTEAVANHPPYAPSDPSPVNEAMGVAVTTALSWTGGDPDAGDDVTYDVYLGTTNPPALLVNNHTSSLYQPSVLDGNTTYYWKIIAWDNHGASTVGVVWSFTTEILGDMTPPLVKITKPEKAFYLLNTKILPFFAPVVFFAIDVEVDASDNESGVARVEFYIDNVLKGNDTSAPYSWTWSEKSFLGYTLTVIAFDNAGHRTRVDANVWKFF
ncbi:MAG: hypothetical protein JW840_03850, partial [Candidatus Thermoplasmatota archaeon]|nr:hypothetical protein [Candidatus Thermoplasmatota archaeon]